MTNENIREVVKHAMVKPSYLSFNRACFVIANIVGKTPEQVIAICKDETVEDLIAEALLVPIPTQKYNAPSNAVEILF